MQNYNGYLSQLRQHPLTLINRNWSVLVNVCLIRVTTVVWVDCKTQSYMCVTACSNFDGPRPISDRLQPTPTDSNRIKPHSPACRCLQTLLPLLLLFLPLILSTAAADAAVLVVVTRRCCCCGYLFLAFFFFFHFL